MFPSIKNDLLRRGVYWERTENDGFGESTSYQRLFTQRPAAKNSTLPVVAFQGQPSHTCPDRTVRLICECESEAERVEQMLFQCSDTDVTVKVGAA